MHFGRVGASVNMVISVMDLKEKEGSVDLIFWGFMLHSIGGAFFTVSKVLCYILCGLGLFFIFLNAIFRFPHEKPFEGFFGGLFFFYLLWSLFISLRPFFQNGPFSGEGFSVINRYTLLSYSVPLVVFLGLKPIVLKSVLKFCFIYGIVGILLLMFNYRTIFSSGGEFDSDSYQVYIGILGVPLQFLFSASLMILFAPFVSVRYFLVGFISIAISIFTVLVSARRGNVFMLLVILLFGLYIYASRKGSRFSRLVLVTIFIAAGVALFNSYADSTFSFFLTRLEEDTRSGVEESFMSSFNKEPIDWIFGRGINGSYFCGACSPAAERGEIETGYLFLILKGGIVYLGLFIFFLAYSAYKGLFVTNNMLTKGMASILIAHILFLVPFGLPAFDLEYVIVWICVFCCQSKEWRACSDQDIKAYLNFG